MTQSSNIALFERVGRYIFGSVILIGILQLALPPSLAFVSVFVILTAIIAWDPFYALCAHVKTLVTFMKAAMPYTKLRKELALENQ